MPLVINQALGWLAWRESLEKTNIIVMQRYLIYLNLLKVLECFHLSGQRFKAQAGYRCIEAIVSFSALLSIVAIGAKPADR